MTKIMSVYFNGTDDSNHIPKLGRITLAALLDQLTVKDSNNISICVNGCGIETNDFRDLKVVFTFYLEKQVLNIAKKVEEIVKNSNENVILNIYGFSRGGAATFWLAQKLKHFSDNRLIINIASFEPVPGNFIISAHSDLLLGTNTTLSAAVADLTECKNIANMLILFTNKPLPDIACHAPILPAFPASSKTEVDVTPGCHKSAVAFYKRGDTIKPANNESAVAFHRIIEFMQKCGTTFNSSKYKLDCTLVYSNESKQTLLSLYDNLTRMASYGRGQNRSMHLRNTIFTAVDNKQYLNRYHQQLCGVENINDKDCVLSIQNRNPQRMTLQCRQTTQFLQLAFILAITGMIYNKYFNKLSLATSNQFSPR